LLSIQDKNELETRLEKEYYIQVLNYNIRDLQNVNYYRVQADPKYLG